MAQSGHFEQRSTRSKPPRNHTFRPLNPRFDRSDYIPSDAERFHLTKTLEENTEGLEECRDEIEALQERILLLKTRGRGLRKTVRTCRSALSAQRRVPTEIWELVFSLFCHSLHDYSFQIDYDDEHWEEALLETPTLILTQVCSRWRAIATGLPHLWSSVSVELKSLPFRIKTPLRLHFANARDHALSIRLVRQTDGPLPPLSEFGSAAWEILSRHIPRCRDLSVRASLFDLPEISGLSFPNLESFAEEEELWGAAWFWRAIRRAPKLTRVAAWNVNSMLPYSQLTYLGIRYLGDGELELFFKVLASCKRLETLELESLDVNPVDPSALTVEVPSLRKLIINGLNALVLHGHDNVLSALFTSVSMPALISLDLHCDKWPLSLPALAERSRLLERIKLTIEQSERFIDMSTHPLRSDLQSLPSLTHLEISMTHYGKYIDLRLGPGPAPTLSGDAILSVILSCLRIQPGSSILLPQLESISLKLSGLTLNSEVVHKVLEAVRERHSVSRPIKQYLLYRDQTRRSEDEREEIFVPEREVSGRIREAESRFSGAKVVIEDWKEVKVVGRTAISFWAQLKQAE